MKLLCATENKGKFATGKDALLEHGIDLVQYTVDIDEIQGSNAEKIVREKAKSAYATIKKPLVVTDDVWLIHGLNGFPGPYMKDVTGWFSTDDFLRLLKGVEDRRVTLQQNLAYYDGTMLKTFTNQVQGKVLHEPKGPTSAVSWTQLCVIDGWCDGKTIAEIHSLPEEEKPAEADSSAAVVWHELAEWIKNRGEH